MLPEPFPNPNPSQTQPISLPESVHQDGEQVLRECDGAVCDHIGGQLASTEGVIHSLDAYHTGTLERGFPPVHSVIDKLDEKVAKRILPLIGEQYGYQNALGMPVPHDLEVGYHQVHGRIGTPEQVAEWAANLDSGTLAGESGIHEVAGIPAGDGTAPGPLSDSFGPPPPPSGYHYEKDQFGQLHLVKDGQHYSPDGGSGPADLWYAVVDDETHCCVTTTNRPGDPLPVGYHYEGPYRTVEEASAYCAAAPGCSTGLSGGGSGSDTLAGGGSGVSLAGGMGYDSAACPPLDCGALVACLKPLIDYLIAKLPDTLKVAWEPDACLKTFVADECKTKPVCESPSDCPTICGGSGSDSENCIQCPEPTKVWAVIGQCSGEYWRMSVIDTTTHPDLPPGTMIESWHDDEQKAKDRAAAVESDQEYAQKRFGICQTVDISDVPKCPGDTGKMVWQSGNPNYWTCVCCCDNTIVAFSLVIGLSTKEYTVPASTQVWGMYGTAAEAVAARNQLTANPNLVVERFGFCKDGRWGAKPATSGAFGWPDWSKINWGDPQICTLLAGIEKLLADLTAEKLSMLFGLRDVNGRESIPSWLSATFTGIWSGWAKSIADGLRYILEGTWVALNNVPLLGTCQLGRVGLAILARGIIAAAEKWLGVDLAEYHGQFTTLVRYLCQSEIPSVAELDDLRRSGQISPQVWECLVRANGVYTEWQKKIYEISEWRPDPDQAWQLMTRLGGQKVPLWKDWFRLAGLRDWDTIKLWEMANRQIPSPSDLVTFMLRDVADESIDWKAADQEFADKYTGELRSWGDCQHVDDGAMRFHWRAHYSLPSPTQLYVMMHRLRKGKVSDDLAVDETLVLKTLGQNDVAPQWRKRLAAISFRPLTRTDAQRAFFIDALGEKELLSALLDLGYEPANADHLLRFYKTLKRQRQSNHRIFKLYRKGGLPRAAAEQMAAKAGLKSEIVAEELDWIDQEKTAAARRECEKATQHRVLIGELSSKEAAEVLVDSGYSLKEGLRMSAEWVCQRSSKSKIPTTAQLCEFYQWGLLSPHSYYLSLRSLGWTEEESGRIVTLCHVKLTGEEPQAVDLQDEKPLPKRKRKYPKKPTGDPDKGV